ncbi:hypothetical protein F5884DRAFT_813428 [Xylogone sp. PMI_703]|nr:hypothetical protein F5884DRAFT_813428 [Xylogone sp. PMI_703]
MGGSRSLSGCWTCRLRKKKCDEERPFCITCSSLGLYCDGYGEVPSWKDGHSKESRYLAMIKSHIKSNFRRKCLLRAQAKRHNHMHTEGEGYDHAVETLVPPQRVCMPAGNSHNDVTLPTIEGNGAIRREFMEKPTLKHGLQSVDNTVKGHCGIHADESQDVVWSSLMNTSPALKSVPQLSLPDVGTSQLKCLSVSAIDTSTLSGDSFSYDIRRLKARETELVMYYIDTVFYIQFRFYSFAFRAALDS